MIAGEGGLLYLEIEDVLVLYGAVFSCTEQEAADQLRSHEGLESALSRPLMYAHYQAADLALQAAVLAHGIAEGQPFIEGNKRTAALACITFLRVGFDIMYSLPDTFSQKESRGAQRPQVSAYPRSRNGRAGAAPTERG